MQMGVDNPLEILRVFRITHRIVAATCLPEHRADIRGAWRRAGISGQSPPVNRDAVVVLHSVAESFGRWRVRQARPAADFVPELPSPSIRPSNSAPIGPRIPVSIFFKTIRFRASPVPIRCKTWRATFGGSSLLCVLRTWSIGPPINWLSGDRQTPTGPAAGADKPPRRKRR